MSTGTPEHAKGMLETAKKSSHFWALAYMQEVAPLLELVAAQAAEIAALRDQAKESSGQHERLAKHIIQQRDALRAEVDEWKTGRMADATGHMFRCAKINGVWSCQKGCAVAEVEQLKLYLHLEKEAHESKKEYARDLEREREQALAPFVAVLERVVVAEDPEEYLNDALKLLESVRKK